MKNFSALAITLLFSFNTHTDFDAGFARQARHFVQEKNFEKAEHFYRQELEINSEQPDIHFELANVLYKRSNWQEAIAHYEKVVELSPASTPAQIKMAMCFLQMHQPTKAIECLENAARLNPCNVKLLIKIADLMQEYGQGEKSLQYLNVARALVPNKREVLWAISESFKKLERYDEMRDVLKKILQKNPRDIDALHAIAQTYIEEDLYQHALVVYKKIIDVQPEDQEARWYCVELLQELNTTDDVIEFYESLLKKIIRENPLAIDPEKSIGNLIDATTLVKLQLNQYNEPEEKRLLSEKLTNIKREMEKIDPQTRGNASPERLEDLTKELSNLNEELLTCIKKEEKLKNRIRYATLLKQQIKQEIENIFEQKDEGKC